MFPICDGVSVKFRSSASNRVNGSSVKPVSVEVYVGLGAVNQALMFVVPCAASFAAICFCFLVLSFHGMFYLILKNACTVDSL